MRVKSQTHGNVWTVESQMLLMASVILRLIDKKAETTKCRNNSVLDELFIRSLSFFTEMIGHHKNSSNVP